eukprot:TRINITY_DN101_c0_g1_i8.p1 TRINITY_DN101_c0_g1~~TRINITY_DN101_c0_g1_i8.p1  ORF type:complete len:110 (-),score=1.10 TRINITY_DN101_c0_g1_i8:38-367(-)
MLVVLRSHESATGNTLTLTLVHTSLVQSRLLLLEFLYLRNSCWLDAIVVSTLNALLGRSLKHLHVKSVLVLCLRVVGSAVRNLVSRAVLAVVVLEGLAVRAHNSIGGSG